MSRYFKQMRYGDNDARRGLQERLAREEIGDAAYDRQVSHADNRAFRIFGVVFIMAFGAVVLGVAWLGY
ncbi:MAG: hypothetical protein AB7I79_00650 [Rhizobiaceae bacterium]